MYTPLRFSTPCISLSIKHEPDGLGSTKYIIEEKEAFNAAIAEKTTSLDRIAQKDETIRKYKVYIEKTFDIEEFNYFKRLEDGQVFKVISHQHDKQTPTISNMNCKTVNAQRYVLPEGEII